MTFGQAGDDASGVWRAYARHMASLSSLCVPCRHKQSKHASNNSDQSSCCFCGAAPPDQPCLSVLLLLLLIMQALPAGLRSSGQWPPLSPRCWPRGYSCCQGWHTMWSTRHTPGCPPPASQARRAPQPSSTSSPPHSSATPAGCGCCAHNISVPLSGLPRSRSAIFCRCRHSTSSRRIRGARCTGSCQDRWLCSSTPA